MITLERLFENYSAHPAGPVLHHHIAHLGGQHIGRQVRGEAETDIEGATGLEGDRRTFRMQRLALPADVKLEGVPLLLKTEAQRMKNLRALFARAGARLALGAVLDIGHWPRLFRPPGDMDHAVAVLGGHDLAAVIV